jgi:hypothetical protein
MEMDFDVDSPFFDCLGDLLFETRRQCPLSIGVQAVVEGRLLRRMPVTFACR